MSHALERVRVWVVFIISISFSGQPIALYCHDDSHKIWIVVVFFGWIQKKAKSNKHTKTKSTMKPIIENMWKTTLNLVDSEHIVLSRELPLIRCSKCLCMYNIRLQNTQIDAYRWYLTDRLMTIFWDLWNLMIKS